MKNIIIGLSLLHVLTVSANAALPTCLEQRPSSEIRMAQRVKGQIGQFKKSYVVDDIKNINFNYIELGKNFVQMTLSYQEILRSPIIPLPVNTVLYRWTFETYLTQTQLNGGGCAVHNSSETSTDVLIGRDI